MARKRRGGRSFSRSAAGPLLFAAGGAPCAARRYNCVWVGNSSTAERCALSHDDGTLVSDACPDTCGACETAAPTALGCDGAYGLEVSDMKQLERLTGLERLRSVGDDVLVSKLDGLEDAVGFLAALETVDGAAEGSGVEAGVLADFCASRALEALDDVPEYC